MTINDLLEQGVGIQGPVRVIGVRDSCDHVYFEGLANWYLSVDEEWADTDMTYLYSDSRGMSIEIEEE